MATFGKRGCACAVLALALAASAAHAANPSPTDVATARELYKDGADALDAGNPKLAAEKLSAAWALVQTPVIGSDLAKAHRALGHIVEAREAALAVQRLPVARDETARSTQARADADKIASELAPRIPHVRIAVQGLGEGHSATIKLDGAALPEAALTVARQANPGEHKATIDTDDGRHAEGTVTLAEGETKDIGLVLGPPSSTPSSEPKKVEPETHATAATSPTPTPAPTSVEPPRSSPSPLVWVGAVTTGVGLAAGLLTGALALNEASTVRANCQNGPGTDGKFYCLPSDVGHLDAANALATVSTIGFVVSGVGAALIVTGLILGGNKHDATPRARVVPYFGPVSGVSGTF